MVAAPVGFQCRECVAQAAATAPVYTAATIASTQRFRPYVSYGIVAICVAVFLFQLATGVNLAASKYGMVPAAIAIDGQWYRLVSSAFLHGSILHIGFNMLVLVMLGPPLERVFGHLRFVVLYLLAALGGAVCSYVFSPPLQASVGASGAIFGLMGALVVAGRRLRFDITQVLILLGINLAIGFLPGGGIDWRAHLGGLVTGALVALVLAYAPKRRTVLWQVVGCLALTAVLLGIAGWRTASLQQEYNSVVDTPVNAVTASSGTLINDRSYRLSEESNNEST